MRLSDSINKGHLSAYQRWEMTSFEEKPIPVVDPTPVMRAPLPRVSAQEIAQIKEQARQEGYATGLEESHQIGYDAGLLDGQEALQLQQDTFEMLTKQFIATRRTADQVLAQDVLDFALHFTQAMLKHALIIDPALVIPIIQHAITTLPSIQQPAQLFLHPDDAHLVRHKIGSELSASGWSILNEGQLHRGDCRIETANNQINATLRTRWDQLIAPLGCDTSWLSSSTRTVVDQATDAAATAVSNNTSDSL